MCIFGAQKIKKRNKWFLFCFENFARTFFFNNNTEILSDVVCVIIKVLNINYLIK
jgi:hypothetical protein